MTFTEIKRFLLGDPLTNAQLEHEKLPKWKALPVFSSDALSSVAYATEEILLILVALSAAATAWSLPIALVIGALLVIVSLSYRQTISLYPNGGGAYTVAKENLGPGAGKLAGSALLIDYILTVAVSISAGVAAISSAFPWFAEHKVLLGLILITIMTLANLRGARESGLIFSIPTYFFIVCLFILMAVGFYQGFHEGNIFTREAGDSMSFDHYPSIGIFILLKAFSSGCAALTGIEAISNGVPAFQSPCDKNAKKTLTIMVILLGTFFLAVTALAHFNHVLPKENETVLSQIARMVFGQGPMYYSIQISTALILVLAANTAFADFPRLCSVLAADRLLPRQLTQLGDRLVFSNGIISLGVAAGFLVILFGADTHALIPLYSVGVFLSFTLSQSGMVIHHLKHKEPNWVKGLVLNLTGAIATFVVLLVVGISKFYDGAWIIIGVIPCTLFVFKSIKNHYESVARQLALPSQWTLDAPNPAIVVMPISGIHTGVLKALQYARGISQDVRVTTVNIRPETTELLRQVWEANAPKDAQLVVLDCPYRSVMEPVIDYINRLEVENPGRTITVVIPEFVTKQWWQNFLHNQTAFFLKAVLRFIPRRVVISVRYHLDD